MSRCCCCGPGGTDDGAGSGSAAGGGGFAVIDRRTDALDVSGTAAETLLTAAEIGAGSSPNGSIIRGRVRGLYANRDNGVIRGQTWRVRLGGVVIWEGAINFTGATAFVYRPHELIFDLFVQSQTLVQLGGRWAVNNGMAAVTGLGNISVDNIGAESVIGSVDAGFATDLTVSQELLISIQHSNNNANIHYVRQGAYIERSTP